VLNLIKDENLFCDLQTSQRHQERSKMPRADRSSVKPMMMKIGKELMPGI
jgi:hypothetical protein